MWNNRRLSQRLHLDMPLMFGLAVLMLFGLVIIYSAGSGSLVLLQNN